MLRKLLKIEAADGRDANDRAEAASLGLSRRAHATLKSAGLLDGRIAAHASETSSSATVTEMDRDLPDQQFAVPDHGWVEGGGRWTEDRRGRRRVA